MSSSSSLSAPPPVRPASSSSNHSAGSTPKHHSFAYSTPARPISGTPSSNLIPSSISPNPNNMSSRPGGGVGPRQSLDANRMLGGGGMSGGPMSPRVGGGMRPNSEMLGVSGQQGSFGANPEAEAIDKWFEDLHSYEATLEEMAAASLDVNFKEELSAIEQWFRVLSEAERTAALYSLLQSSTQVQIRFFITVLQQMARSDPMSALLSPNTNGSASMEQQMEAKLAQLTVKSPASPVVRQFARQSLNASVAGNSETYLSPNTAALNESTSSSGGDAAALLASQRAKLKANAANRVSAPGQLLGADGGLKSPKWTSSSNTVAEESDSSARISRSPSPRPKSTGSSSEAQVAYTRAAAAGMESQLSPILGGSWASQVNTPLVPMFAPGSEKDNGGGQHEQGMSDAASKLAQWGAAHQQAQVAGQQGGGEGQAQRGIQLDDARKFRRQSKGLIATGVRSFSGVLSCVGATNGTQTAAQQQPRFGQLPQISAQQQPRLGQLPQTTNSNTNNSLQPPRSGISQPPQSAGLPSPMSSQAALLGAQQAAMAAQQNWRNGLSSPNAATGMGGMSSPADVSTNLAMLNMMNGMNGMNMADPNALQNMANLLSMQQQMQQVQQLQALQQQVAAGQAGMLGVGGLSNGMAGPMLSPLSARLGMGFPTGFPMVNAAAGGMGMLGNKRSPGGRSPIGKPTHTPGSGSNPEEELDMKLLNDIPAWLRGLRLHKYTPNFERSTWEEMVMMSDADLEARGVAAVGARRKMLRTFETVRIKKGMALPGDGEGNNASDKADGTVEKRTETAATESDADSARA